MKKNLSIFASKISFKLAKLTGKKGTALPGKVALKLDKNILKKISKNCENIILITGTNGKTTTTNLTNEIFKGKYNVISNLNGSNMIQGVVTPLVLNSNKKFKWGIFEVDEGSVPIVSRYIIPDYILVTNFFRDQLDRYGEVENTIKLVHDSIKPKTKLILNADDPSAIYFNDLENEKIYYSQNNITTSKGDRSVDESIFCPNCGKRLEYEYINYGNIGKFICPNCKSHNPKSKYTITNAEMNPDETYNFEINNKIKMKLNMMGSYNLYNAIGAITLAKEVGIDYNIIKHQIENFKYTRGRMERFSYNGNVTLGLSKNPVGLSEVFRNIAFNKKDKSIMFILNDYGPDGKDISWIWDADFSEIKNIPNLKNFYCTGTRAEDIAIRLKYIDLNLDKIKIQNTKTTTELKNNINEMLDEKEDKYIIGTFTAMPEAKKIIESKIGD